MKTDSDLETETDILIRQENDPDELHGKKVAVLIIDHTEQGDEVWATLKTFFRADDHYFLNAEQKGAPSLIVSHYKSPRSNKIQKYYEEYEKSGPVLYKWVYDVRVSGEVVKAISRKDRNSAMEPFAQDAQSATTDLESPEALLPKLVRIPVLQDIAAGLGLILDNNVIEYLLLDEAHNNGANFGVTVVGDSMTGDGILPGDIALIHQQPSVTNGQIAAIVITTPKIETLGVIKRYYVVHQKRKELAHWLLESSNPASKHLVVIPSGCNSKAIRDFYAERIKAGKITNPVEFYDDAEIAIAGKYVGLIRKS